jgi:hypothetical protein
MAWLRSEFSAQCRQPILIDSSQFVLTSEGLLRAQRPLRKLIRRAG